jgi:hypothetical protein
MHVLITTNTYPKRLIKPRDSNIGFDDNEKSVWEFWKENPLSSK